MAAALDDPGAREGLVKRGRERVREFSWDRAAQRLLHLFADVLGARERAGRTQEGRLASRAPAASL